MKDELLTIGQVAELFKIRTSTLRYYEDIGLLPPAERRSSRRYYSELELRKLTLIQLLQSNGLSLEDIGQVMTDQHGTKNWQEIFNAIIDKLDEKIRLAQSSKEFLEHMLNCPAANLFNGRCPILGKEIEHRQDQICQCPRFPELKALYSPRASTSHQSAFLFSYSVHSPLPKDLNK